MPSRFMLHKSQIILKRMLTSGSGYGIMVVENQMVAPLLPLSWS